MSGPGDDSDFPKHQRQPIACQRQTTEGRLDAQGPIVGGRLLATAEAGRIGALGGHNRFPRPGIKLSRQYVRYAGLAVMVLVVLKVFLWDMSGLEGLYQIGSFLGLGLSLVGIGWLYQHFVQKPKEMEA